jgi:uroporphyrin-III C-methyltransferase
MVALLTAQDCTGHIHLIIGSGPLAASRCAKSLEVGAHPILVAPGDADLHYTLRSSIGQGLVRWTQREFQVEDLSKLGRQETGGYVDAVFVTTYSRDTESKRISELCKRWRVPVNVVDAPELCTFTLLSTHSDGPLQIGITTSGRGCKLSSRIRREIASSLPTGLGDAVERLGTLRKRIWEEDSKMQQEQNDVAERPEVEDEEASAQKHTFNALVKEGDKSAHVNRTRRMRWLSQICEYWPLARLAAVTDSDVSAILDAYRSNPKYPLSPSHEDQPVDILPHKKQKGNMTLAGSGPGHPSLLTLAAHRAIKSANFILADKLIPAEVLALIPRRTPVHIARKFPGNADAAQEEMHEIALQALERGENVLRLKQGDPYLYGRGAEEVEFFRRHGFVVRVIPGLTSSLSAPLFAGIPVTHRGVADEVLICTGTGRKGAAPDPPAYRKGRTVVFLMALHRLENLVSSLNGVEWPKKTPCAVIERASCPDQRVIRTRLEYVYQAVEEEGSRPPGLLVVGEACEVLHKLAEGSRWVTEEGFRSLDGIGGDDVGLGVLADIEVAAKEPNIWQAERE